MDKVFTISFLVAAVAAGAPLLFGTLGEILTEKSGNLNLGVEGMMYMGGVAGLAGAYYYEQAMGASASGAPRWTTMFSGIYGSPFMFTTPSAYKSLGPPSV